MPKSPCLEVGCPGFATYRGRCETHAPAREVETHTPRRVAHPPRTATPRGTRTPGTPAPRIYGTKRWRILRLKVLRLHPVCQACESELATDVDHRTPIEDGGAPWTLANLQALCARCHGRKTAAEVRARIY